MISDSIIFFAGGNSEQMVTIVTGLTAISTLPGHLFFRTNLPWPHEVFIEHWEVKLANRSMASQDMTEVQSSRMFYANSI